MLSTMPTITEASRIAGLLRDSILRKEFDEGGRLPPEVTLSANLGVSRATIREALRILAVEGLIVSKRGVGGGTYAVFPDVDFVSEQVKNNIELFAFGKTVDVAHLLESRILLEVPAARKAAEQRSDADVAELYSLLPTPGEVPKTDIWQANKAFHRRIFLAAGNPILELLASPLQTIVHERFARGRVDDAFWRKITEEHRSIVAAIERGDTEETGALMLSHLERLSTLYMKIDSRHA